VWQTLLPICTVFQSTSLEHVLKNLVHPLCLSICLWVVSGAIVKSGVNRLMQALLELGHPLGPSVIYDANRCSMESKDVVHIQISKFLNVVVYLN
jgi:hypothetical protein